MPKTSNSRLGVFITTAFIMAALVAFGCSGGGGGGEEKTTGGDAVSEVVLTGTKACSQDSDCESGSVCTEGLCTVATGPSVTGPGGGSAPSDADGDGIADAVDNCSAVANAEQADLDKDGKGDACDDDKDGDGVANTADNCPNVANQGQLDADNDGFGNECEEDDDADGKADGSDNCPTVANQAQSDFDGDGIGDECDNDKDGDGVANTADLCPTVPDNQADLDGDGKGDNCEDDLDGDVVPDGSDNCPLVSNANQTDTDGDGLGNACDDDDDGDGVADGTDNCPLNKNSDQKDLDDDKLGDECDSDKDGDVFGNAYDNCPLIKNPDQSNVDGTSDNEGDVCDPKGIWVSCSGGSNSNNGTYQKPLKTISFALTVIDKKGIHNKIFLMGGTGFSKYDGWNYAGCSYPENGLKILHSGIGLYGGYGKAQDNTIERDFDKYASVIIMPSGDLTQSIISIMTVNNVKVDGVKILGFDSQPLLFIKDSTPTISNVVIDVKMFGQEASNHLIGIKIEASSNVITPTIKNNTIIVRGSNLTAADALSAGIVASASNSATVILTLAENEIRLNSSNKEMFGVYVAKAAATATAMLVMTKNKIYYDVNDSDLGGGVYSVALGGNVAAWGTLGFTHAYLNGNEFLLGDTPKLNYPITALGDKEDSSTMSLFNNILAGKETSASPVNSVVDIGYVSLDMIYNTLVGTKYGVKTSNVSTIFARNNIFKGNYTTNSSGFYILQSAALKVMHNNLFYKFIKPVCVTDGLCYAMSEIGPICNDALNNLTGDPLLDSNYRISADSPAIDKVAYKVNDADYCPSSGELVVDIDNNPRPSAPGAACDIGADEYVPK